ncbi:MAG TPA: leucyl aminopeptidase [Anaerolineae bacterium]
MEFRVQVANATQFETDGLIVGLLEGSKSLGGLAGAVDSALGGQIGQVLAHQVITGKFGEAHVMFTFNKLPAARVCVVGLGKREQLTLDRVRHAAASGVRALRESGAKNVASVLLGVEEVNFETSACAEAIAEGIAMGVWKFQKYHTEEPDKKQIESVTLLAGNDAERAGVEAGVRRGRIIGDATNLARDLANEPGNTITPTTLAKIAFDVSQKNGLEVYVIDRDTAHELGMGAFLGVAQGSDQPPAFIVMRYWGAGKDAAPGLGLVGKGITFDSGGISLKPGDGMESMKADMSGGAATIAAMQAIAQLKPKINVTGIVPATENMPSGKAFKPGDILTAMNGTTIEVVNTDAEGRLILADALVYATQKLKLSPVVDAATLTGAIVVALGQSRAGIFSNDHKFAAQVQHVGEESGEKMWEMPLDDDYEEAIKSDWADIKNSGGRPGGSITAARFLKHFVSETPWVHIDIAGLAQIGIGNNKERGYWNKFGTGVPTRTFVRLALALAEGK